MTEETEPTNEILAAAKEVKDKAAAAAANEAKRWPLAKIGLAAGIGSAAVAAAVLFAGRDKKTK